MGKRHEQGNRPPSSWHLTNPNRDAFPPASSSLTQGPSPSLQAQSPEPVGAGARTSADQEMRSELRTSRLSRAFWNRGWRPKVSGGGCHHRPGVLSQTCPPPSPWETFPGNLPAISERRAPAAEEGRINPRAPRPEVNAPDDALPPPAKARSRSAARRGGSSARGGADAAGRARTVA